MRIDIFPELLLEKGVNHLLFPDFIKERALQCKLEPDSMK
ncbi:hypothetical protein BBEV_1522 [Salisediminibacterium beveridgei]|uniref:Uncharacterized protein n=1 Tax=Salisediminibacterium beveridgei TaxID=632773 RepID=A0A1D7QV46_9BACI|nr:hypothetical protein BBEV_1522 [Salisediminibacterium beveridgei]